MSEPSSFDTFTMARVQEDQGNDREALRILSHLLSTDPEDYAAVKAAHDRVKARMTGTTEEHLARLFEEWVDLLLAHQRIKKLAHINDPD
ncbi:MAG: hypothetical protein DSY90_14870 [Deltaproteobacteria bacterium]|nr:MAG: hypothetical protein DSY90_14870 [Deltaproteobacteria bacterium]